MRNMSWGIDLWDQFDNLASYTLKGIEFCDRYARFVKERCEIENEYAARLKKLVKNYQPKKKGEDEADFTCARGFVAMVNEIHDVAGQHEQIAENLLTHIFKELQTLIHECKKERKEHLQEGSRLNNTLQTQLGQLDRVKKKYEKSHGDAEKSSDAYKRADADINLSRAEVEKTKSVMNQKHHHCESCKKEYAAELQKSNGLQTEYYNTQLPKVFQDLQVLEERRIERIKSFISHSADTERSVIPIVNTCIDGMVRAAATVNPNEDIRLVIEKYKSGFTPPGDIPFEDLSNGNTEENNGSSQALHTPKAQRSETFKNTQSNRTKKRTGLFGIFSSSKGDETRDDYSHLPPNQQKKRLQQKIETIRQSIVKETAERDGMQKMRDVYVQNPALGDPSTLDAQLEENAAKIDKLNQELQKYEGYLATAENRSTTLAPHDNSVHHNMSNLSLQSGSTGSNPSTPNMARSTVQSGEEVKIENDNAVPYNDQENESFDEMDDEFTVIGTCVAVYGFEAANEGSIAMAEGEKLQVVEADQGDGWTRVRKHNGGDEGFVPTSYVDLTLY